MNFNYKLRIILILIRLILIILFIKEIINIISKIHNKLKINL